MALISLSRGLLLISTFLSLLQYAAAVGTPFGRATGTTGGGSASPVTPTSLAQLQSYLSDSTPRVIVLDRVWDFTNNEGTTTGKACKPWTCSPNPQLAIDANSWCENAEGLSATTTVTYSTAGTNPLKVASNKTLLGKGNNAGIRGKGLKINNASNIIIQNIKITDINAQFVWGGDALQIDGGSKIWIDHNYFQNIGRQMVVTGYGAVYDTTISNNVFNGDTTYSPYCNGQSYWAALLTGNGDQITFALNYLYHTSGRGPHVGGTSGYFQNIHLYNNYFVSLDGHALDPEVGSKILAEGNYFNTVKQPVLDGSGQAYIPTTSAQASACQSALGRSCVTNTLLSSGALTSKSQSDTGTLNGFTDSISKGASIMAASQVGSYVQAHAGVGIVN
ncbi:pectin lyase-like protein [Dendrothele bispora CBS 962.96]|uniref:pectin lyase n=1 Tax=Dendrothele bispora (strain CBS 962.96) TaxID=1314807 RepID=A0A4S8LB02_DENBC|nr:pectin lyase-like protein [Dendrothele bispora CBS 962.96]